MEMRQIFKKPLKHAVDRNTVSKSFLTYDPYKDNSIGFEK